MINTQAKLDVAREELLDLSMRNKLLNYRPLKAKGVEIVDELPEELFRILVTNGQVMSFQEQPEAIAPAGAETDPAGPNLPLSELSTIPAMRQPTEEDLPQTAGQPAGRHIDRRLQTVHPSTNLQKRLLNTYYTARTYIEEQGVNVLYLALGMLHWTEKDNSDTLRKAPLILVPVELYRTSVRSRFHVRYTGEDLGDNLSLRARLRIDTDRNLPELPAGEDLDVQAYFDQVVQMVQSFPRWQVDRRAIALAFFSFGTFLMYNDLDAANWPVEQQPAGHSLLYAILETGLREPPPAVSDDAHLDQYVTPQKSFQVVDADSSQTLAILDVNQGRNLVIQGPPGTGKSQTITNLIGEALGQGRTVLFVAEKMAALEVVKRRLDQVGLGAACLELHSHKAHKKAFLDELQKTLELGRPVKQDHSGDLSALVENRDQLNAYCTAVNSPVGNSGVTPYRAYGRLLHLSRQMAGVPSPRLDDRPLREWDGPTFRQWLEHTGGLQALLARIGVPARHPFWGSAATSYLPADRRELQQSFSQAATAIQQLQIAAGRLATHLQQPAPVSRAETIHLAQAAARILIAPSMAGVRLRDQAWLTHAQTIIDGVVWGMRLAELHRQYDPWLRPEAWIHDVQSLRAAYVNTGPKWWRFLSPDFRRARKTLAGLVQEALPKTVLQQLALVNAILEAQWLYYQLGTLDLLFTQLFSHHWQGPYSNWPHLSAIAYWLTNVYAQIQAGILPGRIIDYLATTPDLRPLQQLAGAVDAALDAHGRAAQAVVDRLKLKENHRFGRGKRFIALNFSRQQHDLHAWAAHLDRLQEMASFNQEAQKFRAAGLDHLVFVAIGWEHAGQQLTNLFQRTWYEMLVSRAMAERPVLATFNGDAHRHRIARFQEADQLAFRINQVELAYQHWQQLPRHTAGGQLGSLQREFEKKRRHLPIRRLMAQAGRVVQTIKPVFMMSPLSIAQFLPPGAVNFDLVVFDEASQVRPVDAFGAILRGRQTVVVGDSKQLPPTYFFNQIVETELDADSPTADLESILGLFSAQGAPQRMLRWHYRSRHESLIAVSNAEFYDNRLVLFPSPVTQRDELGLTFHYLPFTMYDRGGSRTNPEEALAVAQKVMDHARTRPDMTLGVVAFSLSQMQAIQDQLEYLRHQDPGSEPFFNHNRIEPFFVKNLENVQGDERDVIFISVGYGRDQHGKLTMNFGPLNNDGGERRLNVLTTRARMRCEIFSNFTDEAIAASRTTARGVVALKRYLKYARTGDLDLPFHVDEEADTYFEAEVARAVQALGYDVVHHIGSTGFAIDLGVQEQNRPGRYLLGIESDGPSYAAARSARARDRLRNQVLARMGWHLHHIWSTDWFRNPAGELQRTVQTIEAAKASVAHDQPQPPPANNPIAPPPAGIDPIQRRELATPVEELKAVDYQLAQLHYLPGTNLSETNPTLIARWVQQVVLVEGPVHVEEVARRILNASGTTRLTSRVRTTIERGIHYAVQQKWATRQGDFLWPDASRTPRQVRSHANLPGYQRTLEKIAPEEIMLAIEMGVKNAFGLTRPEIPSAVRALLGFGLTSEAMRQDIDQLIGVMIASGRLAAQGDFLIVSSSD